MSTSNRCTLRYDAATAPDALSSTCVLNRRPAFCGAASGTPPRLSQRPVSRASAPKRASSGPLSSASATPSASVSRSPRKVQHSGRHSSAAPASAAERASRAHAAKLASTSLLDVICDTAILTVLLPEADDAIARGAKHARCTAERATSTQRGARRGKARRCSRYIRSALYWPPREGPASFASPSSSLAGAADAPALPLLRPGLARSPQQRPTTPCGAPLRTPPDALTAADR